MRICHGVGLVLSACLVSAAIAQPVGGPVAPEPVLSSAPPVIGIAPPPPVLAEGTPIRLMILNEVTSAKARAGDRFKLRVDETISVGGAVAIPVGTPAFGEVTMIKESGGAGTSGKLGVKLLYIELSGRRIAISGERDAKGGGGAGETALAVLGLGLFGLFTQGHNAKMKAGELITAYVVADTVFEPASVVGSSVAPASSLPNSVP